MIIFYLYLLVIIISSIITFTLFVVDKVKAIKNKTRIKEETLILASCCGGSLGAMLGMFIANHKTNLGRKWHFYITILLSLATNILIILLFLYKLGLIL